MTQQPSNGMLANLWTAITESGGLRFGWRLPPTDLELAIQTYFQQEYQLTVTSLIRFKASQATFTHQKWTIQLFGAVEQADLAYFPGKLVSADQRDTMPKVQKIWIDQPK